MSEKKRHVPRVRVACDLVLNDAATGEPWLDRRGQWVEYRASIRWPMMKRILAIIAAESQPGVVMGLDEVLAHIVLDWNWDDEDGNPLLSPARYQSMASNPQEVPPVDPLQSLETEEIFWLLFHAPGVGKGKV